MGTRNIDASVLRSACNRYLSDRDSKIERKRQIIIENAMRPRWYRPYGLSRQEAIKRLHADRYGDYNLVSIVGSHTAEIVSRLRVLASIRTKEEYQFVTITQDEAEILKSYLPMYAGF